MNNTILNTKVQEYIVNNLDGDLFKLAFKKSPFDEVSSQELMEQISGKLTAKHKLPSWFNTNGIYYAPKLNLEQTTSEVVASFKASALKGSRMADITGGFGVDSYFFSKQFTQVDYFELNPTLCEIATYNFKQLKANNITTQAGDGLALLKGQYDLIYVDPARRDSNKNKVFKLSDCVPNVIEQMDTLLSHTQQLVIKTSPMLDISLGLTQLNNVSRVMAIALNNELKELLWCIESDKSTTDIETLAFNIKNNKLERHGVQWDKAYLETYSQPKNYLYIPNASIMKIGHFGAICEQYPVSKLHADTHFFTSNQQIDFPGRCFIIDQCHKYNKQTMKSLSNTTALVISRNFPLTVAALRKQWKITDGGSNYLIFTTLLDGEKVVLQCRVI
ncbi:MAG: class I SAM-dependent methyltransferase [Gilvibacter sp.]